jgi:hypothetical protein
VVLDWDARMTTKKLYNFRLPIPLMQQVDTVADNRTEFIIKAVQDALQREMLSSGAVLNQPYLQEYIDHLKKEAAEWKAAALHVSGLPQDCSLADPPMEASEEPVSLSQALCDEELHLEIDEALRQFQGKARSPPTA